MEQQKIQLLSYVFYSQTCYGETQAARIILSDTLKTGKPTSIGLLKTLLLASSLLTGLRQCCRGENVLAGYARFLFDKRQQKDIKKEEK